MKKIAIFFALIIVIVATVFYTYYKYIANYNNTKKENEEFTVYIDKEITCSELATIINKAINTNEKNVVKKSKSGKYEENENDSLNIDVKFIEDEVRNKYLTYNMEAIYNVGVESLLINYSDSMFKCNKVQYHETTGKIKYMLFEQITQ